MLVGDLVFGLIAVVGIVLGNTIAGILVATLGVNLQNLLGALAPTLTV